MKRIQKDMTKTCSLRSFYVYTSSYSLKGPMDALAIYSSTTEPVRLVFPEVTS